MGWEDAIYEMSLGRVKWHWNEATQEPEPWLTYSSQVREWGTVGSRAETSFLFSPPKYLIYLQEQVNGIKLKTSILSPEKTRIKAIEGTAENSRPERRGFIDVLVTGDRSFANISAYVQSEVKVTANITPLIEQQKPTVISETQKPNPSEKVKAIQEILKNGVSHLTDLGRRSIIKNQRDRDRMTVNLLIRDSNYSYSYGIYKDKKRYYLTLKQPIGYNGNREIHKVLNVVVVSELMNENYGILNGESMKSLGYICRYKNGKLFNKFTAFLLIEQNHNTATPVKSWIADLTSGQETRKMA